MCRCPCLRSSSLNSFLVLQSSRRGIEGAECFDYCNCVVVCSSVSISFGTIVKNQSELLRPIPRNSVESDRGCTSRIYFDNAGDNVTLMLLSVTLTSQKPCLRNRSAQAVNC